MKMVGTAFFSRAVDHLLPYRSRVKMVARFLPARLWYRAAIFMTYAQCKTVRMLPAKTRLGKTMVLDSWLLELSRIGPFPIPWRAVGLECLQVEEPTIYCSPHRSLFDLGATAFIQHTGTLPWAISGINRIEADQLIVTFGGARIRSILGDGRALLRVRNALRDGYSVFTLVDENFGAPVKDALLRMAQKTNTRVVFTWCDLLSDDSIRVTFREAFRNQDQTLDIEQNIAFLLEMQKDSLALLSGARRPGT